MSPHTRVPATDQPHLAALAHALRTSAGMTIYELSALSGLDRAHLWRVERGQRNASLPALRAIADALALAPTAREALIIAGGYLPDPVPRSVLWGMIGLNEGEPSRATATA